MKILKPSDFKPAPVKVFNAARVKPVYITSRGTLFVLQVAAPPAAPTLTAAELAQLNADLERLGRRGSRVVEAMRKERAR